MTKENVEEYVDLMIEFIFRTGIEPQLQAFKGKPCINRPKTDFLFEYNNKIKYLICRWIRQRV